MKVRKPICPKCEKQMRHVSTGEMRRTFYCSDCKETKIVKREEKGDDSK
jgi:tRNA(Ile2) C34 agmatinyltransferase TiaS